MANIMNSVARWLGLDLDIWSSSKRLGLNDALGLPPVWFAHNKIVGDIGQLPIDIKRIRGQGSETDERHSSYTLLREQPNQLQAPSVFKEQVSSHAIMYGNGRVAIIRDDAGNPIELLPMMPDRSITFIFAGVKYHATKPDKEDSNDMTLDLSANRDGWVIMEDKDVLHVTGFSFNGIEGLGLIGIANKALQVPYQAQNYQVNQLGKGFRGKLSVEAPAGAFRSEQDAKRFIDEFNKHEAGAENAGKAALLREGIKLNALNVTNSDAQFVELQKFSRQDVGLLFGLESMPGDGDSVSYNSLEQKNQAYLVALDRWLVKWEEQLDNKLLSLVQKNRRSHYHKFNRAAILRTDLATTMTAFVQAIGSRIMNPNECRAKLDMNPYQGGDVYENPAVTPGQASDSSGDDSNDDDADETAADAVSPENRRAIEETITSLLRTEANNATNAAGKKNFAAWINKNYAKWEAKLCDKFEAIGLDRDLARTHCEESVSRLVRVATSADPEHLRDAVAQETKDWSVRVHSILESLV